MMRRPFLIIVMFLAFMCFGGCGNRQEEEGFQSLSRLEIYEADGETLINTVEDKEKLIQFQKAGWQQEADGAEAAGTAGPPEGKEPFYSIAVYKPPAALLNNRKPEKIYTVTLYRDTNVIRMAAEPDSIKNISVPEEWLTFYYEISQEDMDFLLSLAGEETADRHNVS